MIDIKVTFENAAEIVAAIAGEVFPVRPELQRRAVTPTEEPQTVTPEGYYGLSAVDVGAIPPEYVIPSGTEQIAANGQHDVSGKAVADVNVQPVLQSKSVTPTRAAQTVTPDSGKDGLSAVEVGGIPSEYVIPTGSKSITENGTHDVTDYASAVVAVPGPSGQIEITENGTVDVAAFASALVNVAGGGGASNVVTGTFSFENAETDPVEKTITIPYNGTGYPVALMICVEGGESSQNFMNSYARYSIGRYIVNKYDWETAPAYVGTSSANDSGSYVCSYKGASNNSFSNGGSTGTTRPEFYSATASLSNAYANVLRIGSAKTLRVYVRGTGEKYGFMSGITYRYVVVYSS